MKRASGVVVVEEEKEPEPELDEADKLLLLLLRFSLVQLALSSLFLLLLKLLRPWSFDVGDGSFGVNGETFILTPELMRLLLLCLLLLL